MLRTAVRCIVLLFLAPAAMGAEAPAAGDKLMPGISIVGNDDAPKSLVIVPWKSSELGGLPGVSRVLDDGREPVDRDVFRRELDYYQIRVSGGAPGSGER
jgi:hypothetical protein